MQFVRNEENNYSDNFLIFSCYTCSKWTWNFTKSQKGKRM